MVTASTVILTGTSNNIWIGLNLSNISWDKGVNFPLDQGKICMLTNFCHSGCVSGRSCELPGYDMAKEYAFNVCSRNILPLYQNCMDDTQSLGAWRASRKLTGTVGPHLWVRIRQLTCKERWRWHKGAAPELSHTDYPKNGTDLCWIFGKCYLLG